MRRSLALWLLISSIACGCAAGLAAPAALATGSPGSLTSASSNSPGFGITSGGAATTPQVQTQTASTVPVPSTSGGLSGTDGIIIAVIAAMVLGGICFFIWYDARGHASSAGRGGGDEALFGARAHAGSKTPQKPRKLKPAERKRRKRGRAR